MKTLNILATQITTPKKSYISAINKQQKELLEQTYTVKEGDEFILYVSRKDNVRWKGFDIVVDKEQYHCVGLLELPIDIELELIVPSNLELKDGETALMKICNRED